MDYNLIALALIAAVVVGAVIFIRTRSRRSKGPNAGGGSAPFGIDNNEH